MLQNGVHCTFIFTLFLELYFKSLQWDPSAVRLMEEVRELQEAPCWKINLICSHSIRVPFLAYKLFRLTFVPMRVCVLDDISIISKTCSFGERIEYTHSLYTYTYTFIHIIKVGDLSRGWPEVSLFNSHNTDIERRALLLSLDCSTLPLILTL